MGESKREIWKQLWSVEDTVGLKALRTVHDLFRENHAMEEEDRRQERALDKLERTEELRPWQRDVKEVSLFVWKQLWLVEDTVGLKGLITVHNLFRENHAMADTAE